MYNMHIFMELASCLSVSLSSVVKGQVKYCFFFQTRQVISLIMVVFGGIRDMIWRRLCHMKEKTSLCERMPPKKPSLL